MCAYIEQDSTLLLIFIKVMFCKAISYVLALAVIELLELLRSQHAIIGVTANDHCHKFLHTSYWPVKWTLIKNLISDNMQGRFSKRFRTQ
jgi:hypothetical protein